MSGASYEALAKLLNPEQLRAATTLDGPLLILAGAGSGKTRVLVHRAAHILHEGKARPWELFCVTFTNKAAGEMRERLEKLIGPEVKSAWIGTFHAMSARILRYEGQRLGYLPSFTIYDTDDTKRLIKKLMDDKGLDANKYGVTPALVMNEIDRAKNRGLTPEQFAKEVEQFAPPAKKFAKLFYFKYRDALKRANAMDFGDLLLLTVELMRHHPEAKARFARRFRYVMVDEFQDTNSVQYELLRHLTEVHGNLAVVGDDDQSIYRWRGAEVSNILEFDRAYPGATVVKLEQNYRSTKNVITAANTVIRQNSQRHDKTLFTDQSEGAAVGLGMFDYGDQEALVVTRLLRARIDHGAKPDDFAILYRQNAQSRAFEEQMVRQRVPFRLIGGTGFYERREVKDILAYLRLVANPRSRADFERVLNVPSRKIGATTVKRLRAAADARGAEGTEILELDDAALEAEGVKGATLQRLRKVGKLFAALRAYAETADAAQVAERVIEATGYEAYLDKSDPGTADDRKANVEELVSSIAEHEAKLGTPDVDEASPDADLGFAGAKTPLQDYLDRASLTTTADDDDDIGRVSLLTLHSAKGLEFPVVFMVGMEEMTFPSKRVIESMESASMEEERRLCYVGMTRAMQELNLTCARMRRIYGTEEARRPSRFLAELPPQVVGNLPLGAGADYVPQPRPDPVEPEPFDYEDRGDDRIEYDAPPPPEPEAPRPVAPAPSGGGDLKVGDPVFHNLFGRGRVVGRDAPGPKGRLSIQFEGESRVRKVVARFVRSG